MKKIKLEITIEITITIHQRLKFLFSFLFTRISYVKETWAGNKKIVRLPCKIPYVCTQTLESEVTLSQGKTLANVNRYR